MRMSSQNSDPIQDKLTSALRRLKERLSELESEKEEPIAIVGMDICLPGINTLDDFWSLLLSGGTTVAPIPRHRWNLEAVAYDRLPGKGSYFRSTPVWDHRIEAPTEREDSQIDPQQRLVVSVAAGAIEAAGYRISELRDTQTGVFVGCCSSDFLESQPDTATAYSIPGASSSFLSGRLSYLLGVRGPSLTLDTACSSSLVAVHQACQSLRNGECKLAIAAGVNFSSSAQSTARLAKTKALSPTGECRAFDRDASGFVRGEGAGAVVLKRLSMAKRDNDTIFGVIRGSGVNHDGASDGLTAPSTEAQRLLISEVLSKAKVRPEDVAYVESHGTGTLLGDPIEFEALKIALEAHSDHVCKIGTLKPNIGHTEGAAGIVGLIKLALVLGNRRIPGNIGLENLNPYLSWEGSRFQFPTCLTPLPGGNSSIGGLSSFGMSGTNAHLLLEGGESSAFASGKRGASRTWNTKPLQLRSGDPASFEVTWKDIEGLPQKNIGLIVPKGCASIARVGLVATPLLNEETFCNADQDVVLSGVLEEKRRLKNQGFEQFLIVLPHPSDLDMEGRLSRHQTFLERCKCFAEQIRSADTVVALVSLGSACEIAASAYAGVFPTLYQETSGALSQYIEIEKGLVFDDLAGRVNLPPSETRLRVTAGGVKAARLAVTSVPCESVIRPDASYLVTGGMGALGQEIIRSLVRSGAREILSVSRTAAEGLSQSQSDFLKEMRDLGCNLTHAGSELSDAQMLKSTLNDALSLPLRGVIHAAGTFRKDSSHEDDAFQSSFENKCRSAWIVHQATCDLSLDFFSMLSSVTAIWGTPGYASYGFANGALAGLAQLRLSNGLPASCIHWGAWDSGMGDPLLRSQLERAGLRFIQGNRGADLGLLYATHSGAFSVAAMDWPVYLSNYKQRFADPFFDEIALLVSAPISMETDEAQKQEQSQCARVSSADATAFFLKRIAEVSGLLPERIDRSSGLFDLGVDSLTSIALVNDLETDFGIRISIADLYAHPTVGDLIGLVQPRALCAGAEEKTLQADTPEDSQETGARDVAVVGMACRFPGSAHSPDEFWRLLCQEHVAIERRDALRGGDSGAHHCFLGMMRGVDEFDAGFFSISPTEARSMDPQQRIALMVAWEALEDAGMDIPGIKNSDTGVFCGATQVDFKTVLKEMQPMPSPHETSGTALNGISGRISYVLGAQGPSLTVDTACSSSLVALHLAVQSIRAGESSVALAGGVNVILDPRLSEAGQRSSMLSAEGLCKSFSDRADGFVRSEGCGFVVLKGLAQAEKDGDRIYGVIRGSAVKHDGASHGFTVPNGASQEKVIRAALRDSKLTSDQIAYVEAHGTGTRIGDPIELQALSNVYSENRDGTLLIGSVKSNLGHMESAAGIGGLIKILLSFQNGKIPKSVNALPLNSLFNWEGSKVQVVSQETPLSNIGGEQRLSAGLSGFGFSGTNAHIIVSRYDEQRDQGKSAFNPQDASHPLVLSAGSEEALKRFAWRLYESILAQSADGNVSLADLSYTLSRRSQRSCVRSTAAKNIDEVLEWLLDVSGKADGQRAVQILPERSVWLFSGQGSQRTGMGAALYQSHVRFREVIDRCSGLLGKHVDFSLTEVLFNSEQSALLESTAVTQPALFCYQVALGEALLQEGVRPDACLGHSIGEYAAAYFGGVFDLETGLSLVTQRGRLMQSSCAGRMIAINESEEAVLRIVGGVTGCTVAGINGPAQTVVSGCDESVRAVEALCKEKSIRTVRLKVSHAFHSALMDPILDEYRSVVEQASLRPSSVPIYSNVTGRAEKECFADPEYWVRQLRQAVRFSDGVHAALDDGSTHFVELGPDNVLLSLASKLSDRNGIRWIATQSRSKEGVEQFAKSVALLSPRSEKHVSAEEEKFQQVSVPTKGRLISLPPAEWNVQKFWPNKAESVPQPCVGKGVGGHSAHLGERVRIPHLSGVTQLARRTATAPIYLDDHRLFGTVVAPGAAHISWIASALSGHISDGKEVEISGLAFPNALILSEDGEREISLRIEGSLSEFGAAEIQSRECGATDDESWALHCSARVRLSDKSKTAPVHLPELKEKFCTGSMIAGSDFYTYFRALGYTLGPAFCWIQSLSKSGDEAFSRLSAPHLREDAGEYILYPGLIDSCFQTLAAMMYHENPAEASSLAIPFSAAKVRILGRATETMYCHVRARGWNSEGQPNQADLSLYAESGELLMEVEDFRIRHALRSDLESTMTRHRPGITFTEAWTECELPASSPVSSAPSVAFLKAESISDQIDSLSERLSDFGFNTCAVSSLGELDTVMNGNQDTVIVECLHITEHFSNVVRDRFLELMVERLHSIRSASAHSRAWRYLIVLLASGAIETDAFAKPLAGLASALSAEEGRSAVQVLQLPLSEALSETGAGVLRYALQTPAEERLKVSEDRVLKARLQPLHPQAGKRESLGTTKDKWSVLVSGGYGDLGQHACRWALSTGALRVFVLSREKNQIVHDALLKETSRSSDSLVHIKCDLTERRSVDQALALISCAEEKICFIHSAGVLSDAPWKEVTTESLRRVCAARNFGFMNVFDALEAVQKRPERVIAFSSQSSVLGTSGQAAYSLSNAWLDAMVSNLRSGGVEATAINWSAIAGSAMIDTPQVVRKLRQYGVKPLNEKDIFAALDLAWESSCSHFLVADVDFNAFSEHVYASRGSMGNSFLSDLLCATQKNTKMEPEILFELFSCASESRQLEVLSSYVLELIASLIGVTPDLVDRSTPFSDLGLDSLLVIEMRARLESVLKTDLPVSLALDYPTLHAITGYLLKEIHSVYPQSLPKKSGVEENVLRSQDEDLLELIESMEVELAALS